MKHNTRGTGASHGNRVQYHHPLPVAARRVRWSSLLATETGQSAREFFDHLDPGSPPEAHADPAGELDDPELPCRAVSALHLRASGSMPEFPQPGTPGQNGCQYAVSDRWTLHHGRRGGLARG